MMLVGTDWTPVVRGHGGLENLVVGWADELARRHDVYVASFGEREDGAPAIPGEPFRRITIERPHDIAAACERHAIEVVQLNNRPQWLEFTPGGVVSFHNYSEAWSPLGDPTGTRVDMMRSVGDAAGITAVSRDLARHVANVAELDLGDVQVVAPFVDAEFLGLPAPRIEPPHVLFANRLIHKKGPQVLVDAKANGACPGVEFHFTDYTRPWPSATAEHETLRQRVRETPGCRLVEAPTSRAAMARQMGRAAVVVVPSIEPEPFGLTSIEAQAVGTPVVVTDVGGLPETLGPNVHPVPAGDPAALTAAIGAALIQPVNEAGRAWVRTTFDRAESARTLERVLSRAAARPRRTRAR